MHKFWIILHEWLTNTPYSRTTTSQELTPTRLIPQPWPSVGGFLLLRKYKTIPNSNSRQLLLLNMEDILYALNLFVLELTYFLAANS
jgi:hypothetical protein